MRENLSEIMFCRRMAYDLSRPMVDNGQMKKCLPTLDFLLTRARAFEKPTIPPGIGLSCGFTLSSHRYYRECAPQVVLL